MTHKIYGLQNKIIQKSFGGLIIFPENLVTKRKKIVNLILLLFFVPDKQKVIKVFRARGCERFKVERNGKRQCININFLRCFLWISHFLVCSSGNEMIDYPANYWHWFCRRWMRNELECFELQFPSKAEVTEVIAKFILITQKAQIHEAFFPPNWMYSRHCFVCGMWGTRNWNNKSFKACLCQSNKTKLGKPKTFHFVLAFLVTQNNIRSCT